jgi:hypothetical protein
MNKKFENDKLDALLSAIRNEQADDQVVLQARERVWKSIAGADSNVGAGHHTLRSCEDFQRLIPEYLAKDLAPARALLFEDHVHACVACRRAWEQARAGEMQPVWRPEPRRPSSLIHNGMAWRWAMGAVAVVAVAAGGLWFGQGMLPGQRPVRAAVETVDGSLYAGSGADIRLIPAGYAIRKRRRDSNGKRIEGGGAIAGRYAD